MRTFLLAVSSVLLAASCGGGPTEDLTTEFQTDVCAVHTSAGSPFMAGDDAGEGVMHQLHSSDTPNAIALPAGAPGFVGMHVGELHTTIMLIVKNIADVGPVTQGGAALAESPVFDMGPVPASMGCSDLFYLKLHIDDPGDYELQLPSNAANSTWLAFKIVQVGHDI